MMNQEPQTLEEFDEDFACCTAKKKKPTKFVIAYDAS
jgi:hypothetical protein